MNRKQLNKILGEEVVDNLYSSNINNWVLYSLSGEYTNINDLMFIPRELSKHLYKVESPDSGNITQRGSSFYLYIRDKGKRVYCGAYGRWDNAVFGYYTEKLRILETYKGVLSGEVYGKIKLKLEGLRDVGKV